MEDIKLYTFKNKALPGFEIVRLRDFFATRKKVLTQFHRANFYHILWFQEGTPTHHVDFEAIPLPENSMLFLNSNVVHKFDDKTPFDGIGILFTDDFFGVTESDLTFLKRSVLFNHLYSVSHCFVTPISTELSDLTHLMERALEGNNDIYQVSLLQKYLSCFLLLAERTERNHDRFGALKKSPELDCVVAFKDLLEKNYKQKKQVSHYVSDLHTTEKRLAAATSKILGKSPKQMIDARVILEARRLLSYTNHSVKEVGFSLGFDEPTNFIKFFRKHTQQTPLAFKENFPPA